MAAAVGRDDVILKEGHRVIVVEYDQDGKHNTKVSISSPSLHQQTDQELICDAFGKCTQRVATALGKAKESAHETRDKAADTKGAIGDALGKAKGAVVQKGQDVKEKVKESIDKAKEAATTAKDTAKTMGADIVTNTSEQEALNTVMGIVNLLGLATAYGMSVWVTFISSYILAGQLPRQQFGVVQSKIYPVYFRAMAYSIGMALLGHLLWHRKRSISSPPEVFQAINLLSSLFMVLVNGLYLEPKATKVMFERMKMEKEDGRGRHDFVAEGSRAIAPTSSEQEVIKRTMGRLNVRLKKLNTNSSMLNILTLMALTWHLVYLGQRLTLNC
ncbi:hypothetical protein V6Z12_D13G144300 [Gossypium hirsutum]